jgi:hypothetical protein
VLDCIEFLRHFLHLFHRIRLKYLDAYHNLVMTESESAVGHSLKISWLALRNTAEVVEAMPITEKVVTDPVL